MASFWDFIKFRKQNVVQSKLLQGYASFFSSFGNNIYANDIVQMCVDCIATEATKLNPKHILIRDGVQNTPSSDIQKVLKNPNPFMTMKDFIEKTTWILFLNYNCFIYPRYVYYLDGKGMKQRWLVGLYPINPSNTEFMEDESGTLFVKFSFENGEQTILEYSSLIHLRKKYSMNDLSGGGKDGQPDNTSLLKTLNINETILSGLEKAVKVSNQIMAVYKINTLLSDDKKEKEIASLKSMIDRGSGIIGLDLSGDLHDFKIDPKLIDKDTLEFVESKITRWFGVSKEMLNGNATDEQKEAFYEKVIEPLSLSFSQGFTKILFTPTELSFGNEIIFYTHKIMQMSLGKRLEMVKSAGEQGLLTNDEKLEILGIPPVGGEWGASRYMSLNWINSKIADQYQLNKSKLENKSFESNNEIMIEGNASEEADLEGEGIENGK